MTGQFDPYRTWLGIPPERQPPNHYHLLGIPLFEEDPTVITHAADQRMGFLRTFQAGSHQAESQRLLNEVAAARVCLLNVEKKAAYDRQLRADLAASGASRRGGPARSPAPKPRPKPVPAPTPEMPVAQPLPEVSVSAGSELLRRPNQNLLRILKFAATGFALAVLVGMIAWLGSRQAKQLARHPTPTPSPEVPAPRPEGPTPPGEQPEGPTPPGEQPEGPTPPGEQPEGPTTPGEHPEGPTTPGEQPQGPTTPREQPQGPTLPDQQPEGPATPGEQAEGPTTPGEQPQGPTPPGEQPEGPRPPGEQPEGPTPPGEQPEGPTTPGEQSEVPTTPGEQPEGRAPPKSPIPSPTAQEELRKRLDEIYELGAERTAEEKFALAQRLDQLTKGTDLSPAERFVVMRLAAELAVDGGELDWAFSRLERMGESYEFDVFAAQVFFLKRSAAQAEDGDAVGKLVQASKKLASQAVAAGRYELALSVADAAYEASRRVPGRPFREEVFRLRAEMTELNKQWQAAEQARAQVKEDPNDAEAHLALGRTLCLFWNKWEEGLPHLAKGNDSRLAQAAAADLATNRADASACLKAADGWWDLAEQSRGEEHTAFQRRALWWYREAVPDLTGLELVKATERLKQLEEQLGSQGTMAPGGATSIVPATMPELSVIGRPMNLGPIVNSTSTDESPSVSADGRNLLFSSYRRRPGLFVRYSGDLWTCSREKPGQPWGPPIPLPVFNSSAQEADPFVSRDGLCILFASNRPDGNGGYDLYMSTRRTVRANWTDPVNLGPVVNSSSDERQPFLSADGLTLYFSSSRPGGKGYQDIWKCTRESTADAWSQPVSLPAPVNGSDYEGGPCLSKDGRVLIFHSSRDNGVGSYDIYMAARRTTSEPWGEPVNLQSLNSTSADSQPFLSADETELYFTSSRPGGRGGRDLWMCRVSIK